MTAFAKETDLCTAFIAALPKGWVAYPETGGFDIVLLRSADGFQIGVEAKLKLNAKVICQVAEGGSHYDVARPSPDCRAVLVPETCGHDLAGVCTLLGITVIRMHGPRAKHSYGPAFQPSLPNAKHRWDDDSWFERCPAVRVVLPDWVPDVVAGASAPVALTPWKVAAIKIVITLQKRGYVTRQDFHHFQISMSRWSEGKWLVKDGQGGWIAGPYLPDFKVQHPVNFDQIAADFEKWKSPATAVQRGLFAEQEA